MVTDVIGPGISPLSPHRCINVTSRLCQSNGIIIIGDQNGVGLHATAHSTHTAHAAHTAHATTHSTHTAHNRLLGLKVGCSLTAGLVLYQIDLKKTLMRV
ncbi:MAG: hypothetical protein OEX19_08400 [Gammaproteobacteria bacterium]|nr:hypothetical protein [Gammaproteobacteria bacterium]